MNTRIFGTAIALVFLSACAASVDPAMQNRIAEWFNKTSSKSYEAGAVYQKPMPFAVGQYVVQGTTDGDDHMIHRTALVGREGDAWIMESTTLTKSGETMMQMAVSGMEKVQETLNTDDLDIKWIKIRDKEGNVQTMDGMTLSLVKGTYSKALTGIAMKFDAELGMAMVRVPAGTFNGCTKATSKVETFFGDYESESFLHPKVPLNGVVRSVSKDNGAVTELIEFGTNAKASF
ncbi:MAG: hypothetical protein IH600_10045 [Bacteroidetes bacterium]|nr:hypothetical protein [Bacteroidota bacterium]